jgi:hypothetical protein
MPISKIICTKHVGPDLSWPPPIRMGSCPILFVNSHYCVHDSSKKAFSNQSPFFCGSILFSLNYYQGRIPTVISTKQDFFSSVNAEINNEDRYLMCLLASGTL